MSHPERNRKIVALYELGATRAEISARLGVSIKAVDGVLSRRKISGNGRSGYRPLISTIMPEKHKAVVADYWAGQSYLAVAREHGLNPKTVRRLVNEVRL